MPDTAEAIKCPWCWESQEVPVEDGCLKEHPDIVPDESCRGSGKTAADVDQAAAIDAMCQRLLTTAGYTGWTVKWSAAAPSECHAESKQIWMHDRRVNDDLWYYIKEAFIHEMAHIDTEKPKESNEQGHGPAFFRRYGELLVELADVGLEEGASETERLRDFVAGIGGLTPEELCAEAQGLIGAARTALDPQAEDVKG